MGTQRESVIEHPAHYCEGRKYEPKDVIRDWELIAGLEKSTSIS